MDALLTFFAGAWGGVAGAWVYLTYRAWRHSRMLASILAAAIEDDEKRGAP